jgi:alpha-ketoglutarate-dependent 2,4-dichlorophenoxyacetate dioxygenase
MAVGIQQEHPRFAAIVTGIDIGDVPSDETVRIVEEAMAEYAVVALRGSQPDDEAHIAFSRRFGPLEFPPDLKIRAGTFTPRLARGLYDASNLDAEGNIVQADNARYKYSKGNELFHTDSSFNDLPTKWSLLLAHVIPPEGGNTEFVDTRAVYDDLPDSMKARIEGLTVEHNLWHSRKKGGMSEISEEMKAAMPAVRHPLVRTSENGRLCLYIGAHAANIVELDEAEGRALLDDLYAFATQPHYIYSHEWRLGDLVIWDNRCTLHRATGFEDLKYRRDMRRTTINEYGPERASTDRLEIAQA